MNRRTTAIVLCLALSLAGGAFAETPELSRHHELIDFLAGDWKTKSTYPETGVEAGGELSYLWVLGGSWLRITFFGSHPERDLWETHGMLHWNKRLQVYESIVFFGQGPPIRLQGKILEDGTLSMIYQGSQAGIRYTPTAEGGVFQENWSLDPETGGEKITLRTTYTRR